MDSSSCNLDNFHDLVSLNLQANWQGTTLSVNSLTAKHEWADFQLQGVLNFKQAWPIDVQIHGKMRSSV